MLLEPCLYSLVYKHELMLLNIYVDNIIIACANLEYIREVKGKFCAKFDMTDMGEMEHFLNVRVSRHSGSIHLDQTVYLEKVLKKFEKFLGPKTWTSSYPLPANAAALLGQPDENLTEEDRLDLQNFPYRSFIGAVLYLSMNTRPDIAYAVGVLSRYASKPTSAACDMVVHLMTYLRGTTRKGITFSGSTGVHWICIFLQILIGLVMC